MNDAAAEVPVKGRPSVGAELAQTLAEAGAKRDRSRNVATLGRLLPFARRHAGDAIFSVVFLLTSTAATLGLSGAVRLLVDHLTGAAANTTYRLEFFDDPSTRALWRYSSSSFFVCSIFTSHTRPF